MLGVRHSKSNIFLVWTLHLAIILTWYHANDRFIESLMPGSGAMSYLQGINRIRSEFNKEPWHLTHYSHTSDRVPSQESLCRPPSSAGSPAPRLRPPSKEMRTASTSRSLHLTSNQENCCRYWLYFYFRWNWQTISWLQVIVFIHGGAFILGSYTTYGPHHLLVTDERVSSWVPIPDQDNPIMSLTPFYCLWNQACPKLVSSHISKS